MNITLSIPQYTALEATRARLDGTASDTLVSIEIEQPGVSYVRVTFTVAWGGTASFDIDRDGNIASVNGGESEISTPDPETLGIDTTKDGWFEEYNRRV